MRIFAGPTRDSHTRNEMMKNPLFTISFLLLSLSFAGIKTAKAQELQRQKDSERTHASKHTKQTGRQVVILSMDGFRSDYLQRANTPHLDSMVRVGTSGRLRPSFPTLTFPNHYSLVTGLYPNNHGLVANRFIDSKLGKYSIGDRASVENGAFYGGEPIWNTAERQGLRSAAFFWVGSEAPIGGHRPSHWSIYDSSVSYQTRIDSVVHWLSMPQDVAPRIILWYIDEPDHTGHTYTPESSKTIAKVEELDRVVGNMLARLRSLPNRDNIDFVIVSDHGMATYTPERSVDLSKWLDGNDFYHVVDGVPTLLYPHEDKIDKVMAQLATVPHVKAYRKSDLPARLHYGSNPRIGEIVVVPEIGTYIYFRPDAQLITGGAHGYDNINPEMFALFVALGPDFPANNHIEDPIPNIAVYPLLCRLLGIEPAPNDADEKDVDRILLPQLGDCKTKHLPAPGCREIPSEKVTKSASYSNLQSKP